LQAEAERERRAEARRKKEERGILGDLLEQVGRSATRQISSQLGRTITRSIFGAFFGKK
ncbi:MAG TPA: DUF853 domain-containing protein, partial [Porphyromonadaceae bacterium]|nr:DUF853 domain-containing protein [Porphyromonadaceae bacterium]